MSLAILLLEVGFSTISKFIALLIFFFFFISIWSYLVETWVSVIIRLIIKCGL